MPVVVSPVKLGIADGLHCHFEELAMSIHFESKHHPHIEERKRSGPPKTDDERVGINGHIGVFITTVVGTMWAAYIFTIIALISLPAAVQSHDAIVIVGWIAQTFIQLVLLPIIIVGQNIQARAADKRAEMTYRDADATFHEASQIQEHLKAQDEALNQLLDKLLKIEQAANKSSS